MPAISVRAFEPRDTTPAARLLAARHRRDRARLPVLRADLEEERPCGVTVERLAGNVRAGGVVATSAAGEMLGFLFGEKMTLAPTAFGSMYVPPHSIAIPIDGHAVHADSDPTAVYRLMYASLAEQWVKNGFFEHQTHIVPGDPAVEEAWVSLGFGRGTTAAVRSTGPVEVHHKTNVEIHQASSEDFAVVSGLSDALTAFHSHAPIFWPLLNEPRHAAEEAHRGLLADPRNAHFVAYEDGKAVAMQTFARPGFTPSIVEPEGNVYLFEGMVEETARSGGIGTALLAHSMAWARHQGDQRCTLHFASANPSGAPFWLGQGFVPVEYQMARHVDERIGWARDW